MRSLVVLALLLGLVAPLRAQSASPTTVRSPVVLVPGDALKVTVWRQTELSGEFGVASDSTLLHPLYRDVKVAGVPMDVVEQRMRSYLQQLSANPQFVLEPLLQVTVSGQVSSPNIYVLPPEVTIAQAVVRAGGPTQQGRIDRVRLRREGREYQVDLTYPDVGAAQTPIRSGDQIIVPRRRSIFREYVAPVASVAGAGLSLINLIYRIGSRR